MNEETKLMIKIANEALQYTYAPYSKFKVAACLRTENDRFFAGVNIENVSYPLSICAEKSAISQMILAGERKIKDLLVITSDSTLISPCGGCRQCIYEFSTPNTMIYLSQNSEITPIPLANLLPNAFNFETLGIK